MGVLAVTAAWWKVSVSDDVRQPIASTTREVVEPSETPSAPHPVPTEPSDRSSPPPLVSDIASAPVSSGPPSASVSRAGTQSASAAARLVKSPSAPAVTRTLTAPPPSAPTSLVLYRGDRGPEVAEMQRRLSMTGFWSGSWDGVYNGPLERAVRAFQQYYGVTGDPSGTYGQATRRFLESITK
ncbi:peptidoglycan-binding protein [Streptomyces sp. NBC_01334]|uniref:peptidoglycan-binding protein n=1 Tax=Streptomyces sp. NBC_01334 TaxID=2903827 RepID=UPI002E12D6D4|nr:peptidoglycan-binding protein [Streptomyces sp. NBC_01334]